MQKSAIELVYLFGSRARGVVGPLSDYDFGILFADLPTPEETYDLAHQLSVFLEITRVDVIVLNNAPIELKYNVISEGVRLYEKDAIKRVEFEAETLSRYFDYLPVLRRQRRELLEENNHEAGIQRYRAALRETKAVLDKIRTA